VAPPLALLPLIDFGGGTDTDCRALIEKARVNTGTSAGTGDRGRAGSSSARAPKSTGQRSAEQNVR